MGLRASQSFLLVFTSRACGIAFSADLLFISGVESLSEPLKVGGPILQQKVNLEEKKR